MIPMTPLSITMNIEKTPWTDCGDLQEMGRITRIGRLPRGTEKGKSSVTVLIEMKDGRRFMAETTLGLLNSAVLAMKTSAENEGEVIG